MTAQPHPRSLGTPVTASGTAGRQLAGLLLFVLAGWFLTMIMLAASIAPGYPYAEAAISDLGVIGETAPLFNASLLVVAALNLAGGYLFYRSHRNGWLLSLFALGAIGAAGAGLLPMDRSSLHGIFALAAFVFFNLEAMGSGFVVRGWMRVVSIAAGLIGLAFVALMVVGDTGNPAVFGAIHHGGAERMIVYPVMLWMLGFGGYLMAGHDQS